MLTFSLWLENRWHDVLGVEPTASMEEIQKAYRQLALQHHPDRGGNAEEFKKVDNAYSGLVNRETRSSNGQRTAQMPETRTFQLSHVLQVYDKFPLITNFNDVLDIMEFVLGISIDNSRESLQYKNRLKKLMQEQFPQFEKYRPLANEVVAKIKKIDDDSGWSGWLSAAEQERIKKIIRPQIDALMAEFGKQVGGFNTPILVKNEAAMLQDKTKSTGLLSPPQPLPGNPIWKRPW
jgi:curved DNA-binding protein CbpA